MSSNIVPQQKGNPTLFKNENGEPLKFVIPPCSIKPQLKVTIENNGGILSSRSHPDSIRLCAPNTVVHDDGIITPAYIVDCVDNNKLLTMDSYRVPPGTKDPFYVEEAFTVDDLLPADKIIRVEAKGRKGRSRYLLSEDQTLIRYILEEHAVSELKGRRFWTDLEAKQILHGRTWQSLKDRYFKVILPQIKSYHLKPHEVATLTGELASSESNAGGSHSDRGSTSVTSFTNSREAATSFVGCKSWLNREVEAKTYSKRRQNSDDSEASKSKKSRHIPLQFALKEIEGRFGESDRSSEQRSNKSETSTLRGESELAVLKGREKAQSLNTDSGMPSTVTSEYKRANPANISIDLVGTNLQQDKAKAVDAARKSQRKAFFLNAPCETQSKPNRFKISAETSCHASRTGVGKSPSKVNSPARSKTTDRTADFPTERVDLNVSCLSMGTSVKDLSILHGGWKVPLSSSTPSKEINRKQKEASPATYGLTKDVASSKKSKKTVQVKFIDCVDSIETVTSLDSNALANTSASESIVSESVSDQHNYQEHFVNWLFMAPQKGAPQKSSPTGSQETGEIEEDYQSATAASPLLKANSLNSQTLDNMHTPARSQACSQSDDYKSFSDSDPDRRSPIILVISKTHTVSKSGNSPKCDSGQLHSRSGSNSKSAEEPSSPQDIFVQDPVQRVSPCRSLDSSVVWDVTDMDEFDRLLLRQACKSSLVGDKGSLGITNTDKSKSHSHNADNAKCANCNKESEIPSTSSGKLLDSAKSRAIGADKKRKGHGTPVQNGPDQGQCTERYVLNNVVKENISSSKSSVKEINHAKSPRITGTNESTNPSTSNESQTSNRAPRPEVLNDTAARRGNHASELVMETQPFVEATQGFVPRDSETVSDSRKRRPSIVDNDRSYTNLSSSKRRKEHSPSASDRVGRASNTSMNITPPRTRSQSADPQSPRPTRHLATKASCLRSGLIRRPELSYVKQKYTKRAKQSGSTEEKSGETSRNKGICENKSLEHSIKDKEGITADTENEHSLENQNCSKEKRKSSILNAVSSHNLSTSSEFNNDQNKNTENEEKDSRETAHKNDRSERRASKQRTSKRLSTAKGQPKVVGKKKENCLIKDKEDTEDSHKPSHHKRRSNTCLSAENGQTKTGGEEEGKEREGRDRADTQVPSTSHQGSKRLISSAQGRATSVGEEDEDDVDDGEGEKVTCRNNTSHQSWKKRILARRRETEVSENEGEDQEGVEDGDSRKDHSRPSTSQERSGGDKEEEIILLVSPRKSPRPEHLDRGSAHTTPSAKSLMRFVMQDTQSTALTQSQDIQSQTTDPSDDVTDEQVTTAYTALQQLATEFIVPVDRIMDLAYYASGNLGRVRRYLRRIPAENPSDWLWFPADDDILLHDEGLYEDLERKYGPEGVMQRQLFLATYMAENDELDRE